MRRVLTCPLPLCPLQNFFVPALIPQLVYFNENSCLVPVASGYGWHRNPKLKQKELLENLYESGT